MINELTQDEALTVLANNYIGRIAYIAEEKPHIVPITYFFDQEDGVIISYSGTGHKIEAMREQPQVCFECEELEHIKSWQTIVAHGRFEEIQGGSARQTLHKFSEGVKKLMHAKNRSAEVINDFSSAVSQQLPPVVYIIRLESISGREQ